MNENIVKMCLKNGINHFDTAEMYAFGESEIALGKILKNLGVER